jgi:hypothetical protein
LDNEFDYGNLNGLGPQEGAEAMLSSHLNTGRGYHSNASGIPVVSAHETSPLSSEIPLLTYGEEVNQFEVLILLLSCTHAFMSVLIYVHVHMYMYMYNMMNANAAFCCFRILRFLLIDMLL